MNRRQALGLLGAWSLGCQHSGTKPARRLVKVALRRFPSTAVFYSAYEFGHFDDAGFDIEVVQFRNTNMVVPTLAGGAVDVSLMAMNPGIVTAAMRGAAVRIVAGRELASTTCGAAGTVFGRRKSFPDGLDDLRVLEGKRISFSHKASIAEFYADCLLGSVGLTTDDIEPAYLPYAEAVAALRAGGVDAIIRSQFDKDLAALSNEIVRGPGLADVHPDIQHNFMFFGPTLVEDDPAVGARFLTAYLRGAAEFLKGRTPPSLVEIVRELRMDPELARNACRDAVTPDGTIDTKSVRLFADWCVRKGYVEAEVDIERLIETRFVDRAREMIKS